VNYSELKFHNGAHGLSKNFTGLKMWNEKVICTFFECIDKLL